MGHGKPSRTGALCQNVAGTQTITAFQGGDLGYARSLYTLHDMSYESFKNSFEQESRHSPRVLMRGHISFNLKKSHVHPEVSSCCNTIPLLDSRLAGRSLVSAKISLHYARAGALETHVKQGKCDDI